MVLSVTGYIELEPVGETTDCLQCAVSLRGWWQSACRQRAMADGRVGITLLNAVYMQSCEQLVGDLTDWSTGVGETKVSSCVVDIVDVNAKTGVTLMCSGSGLERLPTPMSVIRSHVDYLRGVVGAESSITASIASAGSARHGEPQYESHGVNCRQLSAPMRRLGGGHVGAIRDATTVDEFSVEGDAF